MWRTPLGLVLIVSFSAVDLVLPRSRSLTDLAPAPTGKLINIGGFRLHLNCKGSGSPTIVMESGAGDFSFDWSLVQPEVARFTRVCTYDRAGYAWSDAGPMPRTMQQVAVELHTLLHKSGEKSPYIFVGHSLGGLIVRVYANRYPKEVAGMVLVASSHEDNQIMLNNKLMLLRDLSRGRAIPPVQLKLKRSKNVLPTEQQQSATTSPSLDEPYNKLAEDVQRIRLWATGQPSYAEARKSEFDYLPEETVLIHSDRSKSKYELGNMPLIVVTPAKNASDDYKKLQADLVGLSRSGRQIIAQQSGHHIQLDEPEVVTDAIKQIVNAVRHKKN